MKSLMLMLLALLPASKTLAQTNAQILYDFGTDRKYVTLTLEMFKQDKWGSTYFFVDHDFNYDKMVVDSKNISQGGTYTEISRALNFWHDSKLKNWSLHAEYNGGITKNYPINNAWLFGVEYLIHDASYKNTTRHSRTRSPLRPSTRPSARPTRTCQCSSPPYGPATTSSA